MTLMNKPDAAEAAPEQPATAPEAEAPADSGKPDTDSGDADRWRQKYERADGHLREKIAALKGQGEKIASLEQELKAVSAAKAEVEAIALNVDELQKQLQERDFQDAVLTGVAPGKLEVARIMIRGLGFDHSADNAAQVAADKLRQVAPDLFASAPVRSADTEDSAIREGLKGKTWATLSAEQRSYVVTRPDLTLQLNRGAITQPHPQKEKHKR